MARIDYIQGPALLVQVFNRLEGLVWPANPNRENVTPGVFFIAVTDTAREEQIVLQGDIQDGAVDWDATQGEQVENFDCTILIQTQVPGVKGPDALNRADALFRVVQAGFRNMTTGHPEGLTVTPLFDNYRIAEYAVDVIPLDDGYGAVITAVLRMTAYK